MNIRKTLAMTLVAVATAFGFATEAKAATKTMYVGDSCTLTLKVGGRYVNPTIVSATSNPGGVLTYTKYSSLSCGKYFAKVTAKKAGTATIKVLYGKKYYYYYFTVKARFIAPVPPTPSFTSVTSAKYRIYCGKVANAVAYRLRVRVGSASYTLASVTSATTNPSWTVTNAKKGVKYYYWIDVKGSNGTWYGNTSRWRCVTRK